MYTLFTILIFLENFRKMDTIGTSYDKSIMPFDNLKQVEAAWDNQDYLWIIMMYLIKTIDNFYWLFTICVNMWRLVMNGSTFDNLWQLTVTQNNLCKFVSLVTSFDNFWQLTMSYDNFWPFVTSDNDFWQLALTCDILWQLMTTCDNFWHLVTTCDNLWWLVTTVTPCDHMLNLKD